MQLHTNYSVRAVSRADEAEWIPSPLKGVDRKMLERDGDEVARATTIVRYAAGSFFSPHVHTGGEEFIVLDGIFSDEHGDYPAGMYVRNPIGSKHKPYSTDGCTIMVKLWQMPEKDQKYVRTNLSDDSLWGPAEAGIQKLDLHQTDHETVEAFKMSAGANQTLVDHGGIELFVFEGEAEVNGAAYKAGDWLRFPVGDEDVKVTALNDLVLWKKAGHMLAPPPLPNQS